MISQETDCLTVLGTNLHLLFTTRLAAPDDSWLNLLELPVDDCLALLEKHRPFDDDLERSGGVQIASRLGGFTLAVELVGAFLAENRASTTYSDFARNFKYDDLEEIAGDEGLSLRRHHERSLTAVLQPVIQSLSAVERSVLALPPFFRRMLLPSIG